MGTVAEKLEYLNETKTAIRTAIEGKGQTVADSDTFRSYADKIGAISTSDSAAPTVNISSAGKVTATSSGGTTTKTLSSTYDSDFKAANIKSGVTIFGVTGTYTETPIFESLSSSSPVYDSATGNYKITFTADYNIGTLCGLHFYFKLANGYNIVCSYPYYEPTYGLATYSSVETVGTTSVSIGGSPTISGKTITVYLPSKGTCAAFLNGTSNIQTTTSGICYIPA